LFGNIGEKSISHGEEPFILMMEEQVLKEMECTLSRKVLVIGRGVVAATLADRLAGMGYEIVLSDSRQPGIEPGGPHGSADGAGVNSHGSSASSWKKEKVSILSPSRIEGFYGSPGRFHVRFLMEGEAAMEEEVGAVVLANDCVLEPPFHPWGLDPSERILSLSQLEESIRSGTGALSLEGRPLRTSVFVCGFNHPSHPASQRRTLEAALKLAAGAQNRVLFLTEHLKVADRGMERLGRKARDSGVLLVKLTGTKPDICAHGEDITVSFFDEALGDHVTVGADLLVLEEKYSPPEETSYLAAMMGIQLGPDGFFQGDHVYNRPIFTNRTGIWVVGCAKGPGSVEEGVEEAMAVSLEVSNLLGEGKKRVGEDRVQLDRRKCSLCLTCYRLCPHRAISYLNRRPVFHDLACTGCGICAAECPMEAIQLYHSPDEELKWRLQREDPAPTEADRGRPLRIIAFVCENSALQSARFAALLGLARPSGLRIVEVPCAGSVDMDLLVTAFRSGADGVMVLACHQESCKSVEGSELARWRVLTVQEKLEEIGLEKKRLFFGTLAPGAPFDFAKMVREMEKTLGDLDAGSEREKASPPGHGWVFSRG